MHRSTVQKLSIAVLSLAALAGGLAIWDGRVIGVGEAQAQVLPGSTRGSAGADIRSTRHNLSATPPERWRTAGNASAPVGGTPTEEVLQSGEICVFCHTPHGSNTAVAAPLWNHTMSAVSTYTGYSSATLNASDLDVTSAVLATPSKLCLSCHDGTIAIGSVSNAPGTGGAGTAAVTGFGTPAPSPAGTMPYGRNQANAEHGYTRRLGTDLRNDHPISFTYNDTVATADGELRSPSTSIGPSKIAERTASPKPDFALTGGRVQCSTCHEPHRNTQKFLVKNRLAQGASGPSSQGAWNAWDFSDASDQICLGCHTRLGKAWAQSAHANRDDAAASATLGDEVYKAGDAAMRDFPAGTTVFQAGCLNCHDTHTVAGSRRLLREGVNTAQAAAAVGYTASFRVGSNPGASNYNTVSAVENTCFQCHAPATATTGPAAGGSIAVPASVLTAQFTSSTQTGTTNLVPDIATDFAKQYRMPIRTADQGTSTVSNTTEVHEIVDAEFAEGGTPIPAANNTALGYGTLANRHVECTDCHNPHRVIRNSRLTNDGSAALRTHDFPSNATAGTGGAEGNVASGVLRGMWGVEPVTPTYTTWPSDPTSWQVKKGDPLDGTSVARTSTYLTREYQLCFKCHSSYANSSTYPSLKASGNTRGGTATGTNGMTTYTNVAAEFLGVNASETITNGTDQGEYGEAGTGGIEDGTAIQPAGSAPADQLPSTMTDIAGTQNHRSWHPVVFPTGRTRDERRIGSTTGNFRVPFAANVGTQTMHCSDCHGGDSSWTQDSGPNRGRTQGPHGSSNTFLLRGDWSTSVTIGGSGLCMNCHNPTGGTAGVGDTATGRTSGFNDAGSNGAGGHANEHSSKECLRCHVAVPHGWKNKAFLVNLNCVGPEAGQTSCTSAGSNPYNAPPYYNASRLRVRIWQPSGSWTEASCGTNSSNSSSWMNSNCG